MKVSYIDKDFEEANNRKIKRKARNKNKRLKLKIFLFIILIIIIAVSLALSPLCNIKQIKVLGSTKYKNEQIIGATDIFIGGNNFKILYNNISNIKDIFTFRYGKSEQNILKSYPYIKEASIAYKLPNMININIKERTPICIIPFQGVNLLIDSEGFAVDTVDSPEKIKLPVVKGINIDSYVLGQALKAKTAHSIEDADLLIKTIADSDSEDVFKLSEGLKAIDVNDINNIYLFVDNRVEVNLGNLNDLTYKLNFLKQIYYKKLSKDDKGLIDFTSGPNPKFLPGK